MPETLMEQADILTYIRAWRTILPRLNDWTEEEIYAALPDADPRYVQGPVGLWVMLQAIR